MQVGGDQWPEASVCAGGSRAALSGGRGQGSPGLLRQPPRPADGEHQRPAGKGPTGWSSGHGGLWKLTPTASFQERVPRLQPEEKELGVETQLGRTESSLPAETEEKGLDLPARWSNSHIL